MNWGHAQAPDRPLGDVVDFVGGGTPARGNPAYWNGPIPWASVKDLVGAELTTTQETITEEGVRNSSTRVIPSGTVIMASRVGLGKVAIARVPVAINQDLKALLPREGQIDPEYLLWCLWSRADEIVKMGSGATVMGVTIRDLAAMSIPVPPLPEQRRIVAILAAADELRRLRAEADRCTVALIPSLFHSMFGDPAITEGWPIRMVSDVAVQGPQSIRTGPFGSDLLHSEFTEAGIPVLGIDNAVQNRFAWGQRRYISPEKYAGLKRFRVYPGDVMVTIMGTVGRVGVTPMDLPECTSTKHLCVITPDRQIANPTYLWGALLYDPAVRAQTKCEGGGAIMEGWNSTIIKSLRVVVPPLPLQEAFASRVAEIRALTDAQDQSQCRLDDLFHSLLHRAFHGEL